MPSFSTAVSVGAPSRTACTTRAKSAWLNFELRPSLAALGTAMGIAEGRLSTRAGGRTWHGVKTRAKRAGRGRGCAAGPRERAEPPAKRRGEDARGHRAGWAAGGSSPANERSERATGGAWRRDGKHETIASAPRRDGAREEGRSRAGAGGFIYWRGSAARIPMEVAARRR